MMYLMQATLDNLENRAARATLKFTNQCLPVKFWS